MQICHFFTSKPRLENWGLHGKQLTTIFFVRRSEEMDNPECGPIKGTQGSKVDHQNRELLWIIMSSDYYLWL